MPALALLGAAVLPAQESPDWVLQLSLVKRHARANFERMPNYACVQRVARYVKTSRSRGFTHMDTLHLEVAVVDGHELMSLVGASRFEHSAPDAFIRQGVLGTGTFSATPRNLFVSNVGRIFDPGMEIKDGRSVRRYDFEIRSVPGVYRLSSGRIEGDANLRGRFWVDPESLDLVELEDHAVDIPPSLGMADVETIIQYS
jgi:hypothetical protein